MIFKQLKFKGFFLVKIKAYRDQRGFFWRNFDKKIFNYKKIKLDIKQGNISENFKKATLRGFHYKKGKSKETKIITCLRGKIFHVAIDLRKNSKTYLKHFSIILDANKKESLVIPPNCPNAFLTLKNDTIIQYYMGDYFEPKKNSGIRFNDGFFNIKWPSKPKIINKRDKNFPDFMKVKK